MSDLNKEYNKRFQYEKSSSSDFEIEDIWAAVENELDEASKKRGFFYYARWVGIFLLLLILGGIGYWITSTNDQKIDLGSGMSEKDIVNSTMVVDPTSHELLVGDKTNEKSLSIINETENKFDNSINAVSKEEISKTVTTIPENKDGKGIASITESAPSMIKNQAHISGNSDLLKSNKIVSSLIVPNKIKQSTPIEFLESKKIITKGDELSLYFNAIDSTELFILKADDIPKNIAFALGIYGGVNWSNKNYKSTNNPTFADLTNETESGEIGQSFGLEAILTFKDRWIIQSGLEYHRFWSKFEYTDIQTEQILKEDQLTTIWVDGMDTLNVAYGDVSVNRTSERVVLHHNQFAQISIPIAFGFKNRTGRFTYGTTIGTSFNFLLNQSGKRLDEVAGIVEYDTNSAAAPLDNFTLGLRISPFIGYHLSEKIILGLKPKLIFQQHNRNRSMNLSTNLRQIGLSVGIQHEF